MGDIFKNLGGGMGRENTKMQNTYLGERGGQSPLEDIMALLAQEANQKRAERNLLFGGGGYGGSFETAAQKAQRAAGEPVDNSKPYGGWGGYGSDNPVLAWDPSNTRPDWRTTGPAPNGGTEPTVPPVIPGEHEWVPGDPREPPVVPTTGGGGTRTPGSYGEPAVPGPPRNAPPTTRGGEGGVGVTPRTPRDLAPPGYAPPGDGPIVRGPKDQDINRMAGGTASSSKWDDPSMGDSFYRSEMKKQEAGEKEAAAYGAKADAAILADPKVKAFYDGMKALGYGNFAPDRGEVFEVFKDTDMQPEDLLQHYGELLKRRGGDPASVAYTGHGSEFRNLKEGLVPRLQQGLYGSAGWTTDADVANPVKPSERPKSQFAGVPFDPLGKAGVASSSNKGYNAQQAKWDRTFGKAKTAAAAKAAKGAPPTRATAENPFGLGAAPGEGGDELRVEGAPAAATSESRFGAAPGEVDGDALSIQTAPESTANREGETETQDPRSMEDWWEIYKEGGEVPPWILDLMNQYGTTDPEEGARSSQFGPQGFNPDYQVDDKGQIILDPKGNPIPRDPNALYTTQGYAGGDAWSTSPMWRPEEPTGGLAGAYSEMAGGKLTPYENRILEGWQGRANDPMGWADKLTLDSINSYEKTPGRGEDEAYGAYGDMLKGGYSDAEQNAITQEGMRAARAGYETNRDAMLRNQARTNNSAGYAANMAKMARGFSETMGAQGRQNQIDFANEAQRRKEGGASGMLNVAGLANQRGQTSIAARQGFGDELSRRQETALGGQQSMAGYGRDLQKQGLAGQHALYQGSDPTAAWGQAADIAAKPRETYTEGGSASGGI